MAPCAIEHDNVVKCIQSSPPQPTSSGALVGCIWHLPPLPQQPLRHLRPCEAIRRSRAIQNYRKSQVDSRKHCPSVICVRAPHTNYCEEYATETHGRAFSQLVADNQHSPLGLLLLTELARVQQLLADILAIDSSDSSLQDGLPQSERSIVRHSIQSPSNCVEGDKGVTISRDKMALDAIGEQVPPPVKRGRPETEPHYRDCTNGLDRDRDRSGGKKKSKKKQKRGTNDLASLFGSLT